MVKVIGKPKDFGDIQGAWKTLLEKIGPAGDDFVIFSVNLRKKIKYFHARVDGDHIVVDRAKEHIETAQITGERRINFNQFSCVAQLYNEYVARTKDIRSKMTNDCERNTSYIISLIHHLL
jgi:hypothetical protein